MATREELELIFRAKNEFDQVFRQFQQGLADNQGQARATKTAFGELKGEIVQLAAQYLTIRGAITLVTSSLAAQAESEAAINKLNLALANQGNYSEATSAALIDYAAQLQRTTTYEDDAVIAAEALLASFGMNEQQIKRTTLAAANFAAATGTNLESAVQLLGRAFAGNTAALGRYGIVIDETLPKSQRFEAAVAQLEQRFGGSAAAATQTYTGQLAQLRNGWDDVQEGIGKFIGSMADMQGATSTGLGVLSGLSNFFGSTLVIAIAEARAQTLGFFASLAEQIADFGEWSAEHPIIARILGMGTTISAEATRFMRDFANGLRGQMEQIRTDADKAATSVGNVLKPKNMPAPQRTPTAEALKALADRAKEAAKQTEALARVALMGGQALTAFDVAAINAAIADDALTRGFVDLTEDMAALNRELGDGGPGLDVMSGALGRATAQTNAAGNALRNLQLRNQVQDISALLGGIASLFSTIIGSTNEWGIAFSQVAAGLAAGAQFAAQFAAATNNAQRAVALLAAAQSAYQQGQQGSVWGAGATGATAGAQAGGPVGAAIGGIGGLLTGFLGYMDRVDQYTRNIDNRFGSAEQAARVGAQYGVDMKSGITDATWEGMFRVTGNLGLMEDQLAMLIATVEKAQRGFENLHQGLTTAGQAAAGLQEMLGQGLEDSTGAITAMIAQVSEELLRNGIGVLDARLAGNQQFAFLSQAAALITQTVAGMSQASLIDVTLLANATMATGDLIAQQTQVALAAGMSQAEATRAGFGANAALLQAQLEASLLSGTGVSADLQALLDEAERNGINIVASPLVQSLMVQQSMDAHLSKIAGATEETAASVADMAAKYPGGGGGGNNQGGGPTPPGPPPPPEPPPPPPEPPSKFARGGIVLPFLPRAAQGIVAAQPGGSPVIVGEGGETELVAPVRAIADRIGRAAAAAAGGGVIHVHVHLNSREIGEAMVQRRKAGLPG